MRKILTILILIAIGFTLQSCCGCSRQPSYASLNSYIGDEVLDTLPIMDSTGKVLYYKYIVGYKSQDGQIKGNAINVRINEHFWKPGDVISFENPFTRNNKVKTTKVKTTNNKFVE